MIGLAVRGNHGCSSPNNLLVGWALPYHVAHAMQCMNLSVHRIFSSALLRACQETFSLCIHRTQPLFVVAMNGACSLVLLRALLCWSGYAKAGSVTNRTVSACVISEMRDVVCVWFD